MGIHLLSIPAMCKSNEYYLGRGPLGLYIRNHMYISRKNKPLFGYLVV